MLYAPQDVKLPEKPTTATQQLLYSPHRILLTSGDEWFAYQVKAVK